MPENSSDNAGNGMEKMIKMLEIAKMFQGQREDYEPEGFSTLENEDGSHIYKYDDDYYDAFIQSPSLRSMKAAIPHLDHSYRKNLIVFVKLMEIQRAMNYFKTTDLTEAANMRSGGLDGSWRHNMLKAVMPHASGKKKEKLEMLARMIDMSEMMIKFKEMESNG